MKDFCDNLKAFAILILTLFRNGDDENKITVGEFARVHAKKFFAVAVFGVMLTMVSCGAEEKFFGVTGEEFMQRYNDNLSIFKSTSNAKLFLQLESRRRAAFEVQNWRCDFCFTADATKLFGDGTYRSARHGTRSLEFERREPRTYC